MKEIVIDVEGNNLNDMPEISGLGLCRTLIFGVPAAFAFNIIQSWMDVSGYVPPISASKILASSASISSIS